MGQKKHPTRHQKNYDMLNDFAKVFDNSGSIIKYHQVKIYISNEVIPRNFRPRNVPLTPQ